MSSTQVEDKLEEMLLMSSSVSTSLLLVRSFSLLLALAIKAVEGILSEDPRVFDPEGEGVVEDDEAPDEDEAILLALPPDAGKPQVRVVELAAASYRVLVATVVALLEAAPPTD